MCEVCGAPATIRVTVVLEVERQFRFRCRRHRQLTAAELGDARWVLYRPWPRETSI